MRLLTRAHKVSENRRTVAKAGRGWEFRQRRWHCVLFDRRLFGLGVAGRRIAGMASKRLARELSWMRMLVMLLGRGGGPCVAPNGLCNACK